MKKIMSLALILLTLTGCSRHTAVPSPADTKDHALVQAVYPDMAPYPNEQDFIDPKTGIFDDEGFSTVYAAWRHNQALTEDIPDDYAFSLRSYFQRSIPVFLTSGTSNQVCSPLNVYMALAMLAETTAGSSRQEILDLLDAGSIGSLRTQSQQVWKSHYCSDGASACTLANSLWLDEDLTYDPDTLQCLADNYFASVFQGPLGSEEMDLALQSWIDHQTNGLLQEHSRNLKMSPQTVLALASTVYYRAKWGSEFDPQRNTESLFHGPSGDQAATFMNMELTYGPYYWGDDFGAVSLRLEDGSRMWLILPDEGKTPADVLSSRQALDLILYGWQETGAQKSLRVNLSLPKFDIAGNIRLNDPLQALGIVSVFHPEDADFSPILPDQAAWLDHADHAARVKIDEEGVEAAAYTVMMAAGAAMPPEEEMDFILDRPFLFVIASQDSLPLFAGVVNEP